MLLYLKLMRFTITDEMMIYEHGVLWRQREYIELYRVIDYKDHISFSQNMFGLKTVTVYSGDRIFLSLTELKRAIGDNPHGVLATVGMNNLYIETATEMASVYTLLKNAIAEGGVKNMLTGAERSQTLWALNDKLASFHRKLKRLCLGIRYYTLNDVWANVTAGMVDRDNATIARQAKARWKRVARSIHP